MPAVRGRSYGERRSSQWRRDRQPHQSASRDRLPEHASGGYRNDARPYRPPASTSMHGRPRGDSFRYDSPPPRPHNGSHHPSLSSFSNSRYHPYAAQSSSRTSSSGRPFFFRPRREPTRGIPPVQGEPSRDALCYNCETEPHHSDNCPKERNEARIARNQATHMNRLHVLIPLFRQISVAQTNGTSVLINFSPPAGSGVAGSISSPPTELAASPISTPHTRTPMSPMTTITTSSAPSSSQADKMQSPLSQKKSPEAPFAHESEPEPSMEYESEEDYKTDPTSPARPVIPLDSPEQVFPSVSADSVGVQLLLPAISKNILEAAMRRPQRITKQPTPPPGRSSDADKLHADADTGPDTGMNVQVPDSETDQVTDVPITVLDPATNSGVQWSAGGTRWKVGDERRKLSALGDEDKVVYQPGGVWRNTARSLTPVAGPSTGSWTAGTAVGVHPTRQWMQVLEEGEDIEEDELDESDPLSVPLPEPLPEPLDSGVEADQDTEFTETEW